MMARFARAPSLALAAVLVAACGAPHPDATPPAHRPAYYLVGSRGATSFDHPGGPVPATTGAPTSAWPGRPLLPGFGFEVVETREVRGERVGRTAQGRWVAMKDLIRAPGADATGMDVPPGGGLDFAWVVNPGAALVATPGGPAVATPPLHARLSLRGPCGPEDRHCRVKGGWMRATDLRVAATSARPAGVGADQLWIDVDRRTNTLVVHEGDRPVFASLVSTGTGAPGTRFATPPGLYRLHSKARAATMDNLEHTDVVPYSYEDVPDVQFWRSVQRGDAVALHAALWHRRFGHPMSHGCINAAPGDAARLFALTRAPLAASQDSANAAAHATVLRVR